MDKQAVSVLLLLMAESEGSYRTLSTHCWAIELHSSASGSFLQEELDFF